MTRSSGGWVVDTLETLYRGSAVPNQDFGARTLMAMAPGLDQGDGLGFSLVDLTARRWRFFGACLGDGTLLDLSSAHPAGLGFPEEQVDALFTQLYADAAPVSLLSRLLGVASLREVPALQPVIQGGFSAIADALGLPSIPQPGLGLCAFVPLRDGVTFSRPQLRQLTRLAFHLETAVRQRLSGSAPVGVVTPAGRVDFDGHLTADTHAHLKDQVKAIEALRRRSQRRDDQLAMETWQALVAGYLSLFEHVDSDGKRQYYLYENPPRAVPSLALSRVESAVLGQASRGVTNKQVGYALGLSPSQVSRALKTASQKLGLTTGVEAVRLAAVLHRAHAPATPAAALTDAEHEVLRYLGEGLSDEQIAQRRSTSVRTIANQVAAILKKTGAHSRRAFLGMPQP